MNKHGSTVRNKITLFFFFFFFLYAYTTVASDVQNPPLDNIMFQIQTYDQKIKNLEEIISSYSNTLEQLILDSINLETEYFNTNQKLQNPVADFDIRLGSLTSEITELKKQITQSRQDSITTYSDFTKKRLALKSQVAQLEQNLSAIKGTLSSLSISKQSLLTASTQNSDNAISSLNTENRTIDTLLSRRNQELKTLLPRREQLIKDSTVLVTKLNEDMQQAVKNIQILDSMIAISENALQDYSNQVTQLKQNHTEDLNAQKSILQNYTSQKIREASALTQLNISISKITMERQQLRSSIDATMSAYEKGRAPFAKQLNDAENTLNTRNMQKLLWTTMKEVHSLDSTIVSKRNELDDQIQQAAMKRKNATKQTEQKENELNEFIGKLDLLLQKPGAKQAHDQLKSLTLAQRRARIYQVIANIDNDITQQTAKKKQAEDALRAYEQSNPMSVNPSVIKLKQLDSTLTSLQNQKLSISLETDSLNELIEKQNLSINRSQSLFKTKLHDLDSTCSVYNVQKQSFTTKRDQANLKNAQSQKSALSKINQTFNNLKATTLRINTINNEIQTATSRKESIKTELANATELFNQRKIRAQQDAQTTDATITAKQQEQTSLSAQIKDLYSQDQLIVQECQTLMSKITLNRRFLDSCLTSKNTEYVKLNNDKLSLSIQVKNSNQSFTQRSMQLKSQIAKARDILATKDSELKVSYQKRSNLINYLNNLSLPATPPPPTTPAEPQNPSAPINNSYPTGTNTTAQSNAQTIKSYDSLIQAKEAELKRLQAQKNQILQTTPQQQPQTPANPALEAQKIIEQIYSLIGENKNTDAYNLFIAKENQLRANSPAEAVDMLKATFNEIPEIKEIKKGR